MKNQNAFTLFEVILALALLVFSVSVFSRILFRSLSQVWRGKEEIDRIFLIKKEIYDILLKVPEKEKLILRMKDRPIKVEIENPELVINSQIFDIDKKSGLKEFVDSIDVVRTTGEWDSGIIKRKITLLSFLLKPEQK